MAKLHFPLGLVTVLLCVLLCTVSAVTLDQLFVVQSGSTDSGCDMYFDQASKEGTLDEWLDEINYSLSTAIDIMDLYNQDVRIRRAVSTFFGVRNQGKASTAAAATIQKISDNLKRVQEFFSFEEIQSGPSAGQPIYPLNGDRYLFCGSNFLIHQSEDTQALDWQANEIIDDDGNPVTIVDVPGYAEALDADADNDAWWSGDLTPVNGYYFSTTGGEYCDTNNLGLTAAIQELEADITGQPTVRKQIESIIICDHSFTNDRPDSYSAGDALIVAGTNLATVVPKSATLLHEAFHLLFGVDDGSNPDNPTGFLEGDEIYDLAKCIEIARTNPVVKAQRNPESYVFFIAHMYYLFGEQEDGTGTSIDTNWDFNLIKQGANWIYGARTP
ncbi:hypothetical protein F4781DRAFT_90224 [Annulohypoxylon bovei var. microspora]|nr:hypothetical protein F4781DRAFT_90224 [Annulohypoxylon bovei var. microspora]